MLTMSASRLEVTEDEREALAVTRSSSLPHRAVLQAKGLLLAAEGVANNEIARRCAVTSNASDAGGLPGEVGGMRAREVVVCYG